MRYLHTIWTFCINFSWIFSFSMNNYYSYLFLKLLRNSCLEIFDEDGNGEVDFKEFIQGVSQFSVKGDKDTKLRYFTNSSYSSLCIITVSGIYSLRLCLVVFLTVCVFFLLVLHCLKLSFPCPDLLQAVLLLDLFFFQAVLLHILLFKELVFSLSFSSSSYFLLFLLFFKLSSPSPVLLQAVFLLILFFFKLSSRSSVLLQAVFS